MFTKRRVSGVKYEWLYYDEFYSWSNQIHLTSIRLSSGALVGRNTSIILDSFFLIASLVFFDLWIDALSSTMNTCLILGSYNESTLLIKIDKLAAFLLFVAVGIHFIIGIVVYPKHIEQYFHFLVMFYLRLYRTPWWTTVCFGWQRPFLILE